MFLDWLSIQCLLCASSIEIEMHNKLLQQTLDAVVAISLCPRVALAFSISLLFSLDAFGCSCRLGELTEIEFQASLCKSDQIFIAKAL
ncbi:MAG: hypothetical protein AAGJ55_11405, partial [Cyanobacteria bacterium J06555_12]